jgi:hypothetical protein
MFREVLLTGKNDLAGRAMTIICCFAVLVTVTAVGSKKVPQPGVRNAINLLGGKRKAANFEMTALATLWKTRLAGHLPPTPFEAPRTANDGGEATACYELLPWQHAQPE